MGELKLDTYKEHRPRRLSNAPKLHYLKRTARSIEIKAKIHFSLTIFFDNLIETKYFRFKLTQPQTSWYHIPQLTITDFKHDLLTMTYVKTWQMKIDETPVMSNDINRNFFLSKKWTEGGQKIPATSEIF